MQHYVTPLISIVMPTRNSERFLSHSLKSLAKQTMSNYELLICDSSSTDQTLQIISRAGLPRSEIVSRFDDGVPSALNKGFSAARGKILCWLNSDDLYLSDQSLQKVKDLFEKNEFSVLLANCVVLGENGEEVRRLVSYPALKGIIGSEGNVFTGSLFFSRDAWDAFGGFSGDYSLAFEYELIDFLFHRYTVTKLKAFTTGFRVHAGGLSSAHADTMQGELTTLRASYKVPKRFTKLLVRFIQYLRYRELSFVISTYFMRGFR